MVETTELESAQKGVVMCRSVSQKDTQYTHEKAENERKNLKQ